MIRAMAPFRISFGGGGSDVPPYCWEEGGAVVSVTIDRYAYSLVSEAERVVLESQDTGELTEYEPGKLPYDGKLDLLKAPYNLLRIGKGVKISTHSETTQGSGLGGSSSLVVSLIGALSSLFNLNLSKHEIATLAYVAEREELKQMGGYQDQFAAAYGGLNYMEFSREGVRVEPLKLDANIMKELQFRTLLFFLGKTRRSYEIHEDMKRRYEEDKEEQARHRRALREIARGMRRALLAGDLEEFGELVREGWLEKKRMSGKIAEEEIDRVYEIAVSAGAVGGKVLGAGGGGHMMFYVKPEKRKEVIRRLEEAKLTPVYFKFEFEGVSTWKI